MKGFEYQRLQLGEIRLFRVLETVGQDQNLPSNLEGQLQTFGDQKPLYTALSYMWGSPERTQNILVDGKVLYITESLEVFLYEVSRRQRDHSKSSDNDNCNQWVLGWLWIDAICINQDDDHERGQQVRRMRSIYEEAMSMIIWLGESNEDTTDAFEALESIAELEVDEDEQGTEFRLIEGEIPSETCRIDDGKSYFELLYTTLYEIGNLLFNRYWNRVWIIQEASTPKSSALTTVCLTDGCSISWEKYAAANRRLLFASWNNEVEEHVNLHGIAGDDIAAVQYIQDRRRSQNFKEQLYTLLVRFRPCSATDARDKVYALLGISEEAESSEIVPDYTTSVEDVFVKTAKAIITKTQSLDCLGSAGLLQGSTLPTWVADWSVTHDTVPQPFYQYEQLWNRDGTLKERKNLFNASKSMGSNIAFASNNSQLLVRGFKIDTIVAVSQIRRRRGGPLLDDIWLDWKTTGQVEDPGLYVSGCSRTEAFLKIINSDFQSVWGDWSAERGYVAVNTTDSISNRFSDGEAILDAMTWNRRLIRTSNEYIGLAPSTTEVGDVVCIIAGSQMPVVLRQESDKWLCIGQAYVHGIMDGEAVTGIDESQLETYTIC